MTTSASDSQVSTLHWLMVGVVLVLLLLGVHSIKASVVEGNQGTESVVKDSPVEPSPSAGANQGSDSKTRDKDKKTGTFLTFISVIFGLCIGLWAEALGKDEADPFENVRKFIDFMLAFGVLVSLWWWYGIMIPEAYPSSKFWHYALDLGALSLLAFASKFWYRPPAFFVLAAAGSVLVGWRCFISAFYGVQKYAEP